MFLSSMKFMLKIKNIIIISILLLLYPLLSVANSNDVLFEPLKLTIKDYLENREDKNKFFKDIETFGILKDGYKNFVQELSDSLHTDFYIILATLDNEKGDWFEKEPIDFLKMGLLSAKTEPDIKSCYRNLVLAYSTKLFPTINKKSDLNLMKKELDKILNEIDTLNFKTDIGIDLKRSARHNASITERLLGNYKKAEDLIKPLTTEGSPFLDGPHEKKVEKMTNAINELGRIYLSEGIAINNDNLIEKAINQFDNAINILEAENCSPNHLKELYQRKQKALLLLGRENEAIDLSKKLNKFEFVDCWKSEEKSLRFFFKSVVSEEPNYEIVENTILSINQRKILKEQNRLKNYLLFFILLASGLILIVTCLLAYSAYNLRKKRNELSEKNTQLERSMAKLKILQFNSSAVLDTMKRFDANQGKLDFLNKYLIDIFNQFKDQMKEDCGFAAVLFDRKKDEITSKVIEVNKDGGLLNELARKHKINSKSVYYPYYKGKKELYDEPNFQYNFQNHNNLITSDHIKENDITSESIICVPLVFNQNEKPFGIISLQNDAKAFFSQEHIDLMKAIANMLTPVVAYFEINEERNEIRQQKNHIIKLLNHRFRNYIDINNTALQNIKYNFTKWNEEKLREKLVSFGGDFQIYINTFKSFMRWLGLLGFEKNNFESANQVEYFNLKKAIENEFDQLYFPLREHNIKFEVLSDKNITIKNIPKIYISEIIANLLINSIQHFMEVENEQLQPKITIETNLGEKYLTVGIIDNGEGIPENIKHKIFQHTLNGDYAKSEGRGLGNMAVKYLVSKIEGEVRVAYSGENKGTKIEIAIPIKYIKE